MTQQSNSEVNQKKYEIEGVIEKIKYPFSLFNKRNPIVSIRVMSGNIIDMEATDEMIKNLPISIGVGKYTEAQYYKKEDGSYQLTYLM